MAHNYFLSIRFILFRDACVSVCNEFGGKCIFFGQKNIQQNDSMISFDKCILLVSFPFFMTGFLFCTSAALYYTLWVFSQTSASTRILITIYRVYTVTVYLCICSSNIYTHLLHHFCVVCLYVCNDERCKKKDSFLYLTISWHCKQQRCIYRVHKT